MSENERKSLEATAENLRASIAAREQAGGGDQHEMSTQVERARLSEIEAALKQASKNPIPPQIS